MSPHSLKRRLITSLPAKRLWPFGTHFAIDLPELFRTKKKKYPRHFSFLIRTPYMARIELYGDAAIRAANAVVAKAKRRHNLT